MSRTRRNLMLLQRNLLEHALGSQSRGSAFRFDICIEDAMRLRGGAGVVAESYALKLPADSSKDKLVTFVLHPDPSFEIVREDICKSSSLVVVVPDFSSEVRVATQALFDVMLKQVTFFSEIDFMGWGTLRCRFPELGLDGVSKLLSRFTTERRLDSSLRPILDEFIGRLASAKSLQADRVQGSMRFDGSHLVTTIQAKFKSDSEAMLSRLLSKNYILLVNRHVDSIVEVGFISRIRSIGRKETQGGIILLRQDDLTHVSVGDSDLKEAG